MNSKLLCSLALIGLAAGGCNRNDELPRQSSAPGGGANVSQGGASGQVSTNAGAARSEQSTPAPKKDPAASGPSE